VLSWLHEQNRLDSVQSVVSHSLRNQTCGDISKHTAEYRYIDGLHFC